MSRPTPSLVPAPSQWSDVPPVDAVQLESRADELATRSIKKAAKRQGLAMCVAMTDLTTLEGQDTPGKVRALSTKAMHPDLVATAVDALRGSPVVVASVATHFPAGRAPLDQRLADVRSAVAAGAAEIDMVIDRGAFLAGRHQQVADEIRAVKEACGAAHLKVILETGELATYDNIRRACRLALRAGADFIKTSTGKVSPASTRPVVLLMLEEVRDHFLATGHRVGVKAAGGIRTAKDALRYLVLVNETCGDDWLTPELFRFGASSLLNDVLMQWERLRTGVYQRAEDFSHD